jgi:hypothetical protein
VVGRAAAMVPSLGPWRTPVPPGGRARVPAGAVAAREPERGDGPPGGRRSGDWGRDLGTVVRNGR